MSCPDGRPFSRSALCLTGLLAVLLALAVTLVSDGALTVPLALVVGCTAVWVVPLAVRAGLRRRRP